METLVISGILFQNKTKKTEANVGDSSDITKPKARYRGDVHYLSTLFGKLDVFHNFLQDILPND